MSSSSSPGVDSGCDVTGWVWGIHFGALYAQADARHGASAFSNIPCVQIKLMFALLLLGIFWSFKYLHSSKYRVEINIRKNLQLDSKGRHIKLIEAN